jgi:hypothetical protein
MESLSKIETCRIARPDLPDILRPVRIFYEDIAENVVPPRSTKISMVRTD